MTTPVEGPGFGWFVGKNYSHDLHFPSMSLNDPDLLIGVWRAVTTDAPYPDHLITVHSDFTWAITNPTNVEQGPDLSGINDSVGMGRWRRRRSHLGARQEYELQFWQLNAHADTHQPAPDLTVALRLFVFPHDADSFDGTAVAVFGNGPDQPTAIMGTRLKIDEDLMFRVPDRPR